MFSVVLLVECLSVVGLGWVYLLLKLECVLIVASFVGGCLIVLRDFCMCICPTFC